MLAFQVRCGCLEIIYYCILSLAFMSELTYNEGKRFFLEGCYGFGYFGGRNGKQIWRTKTD